MCLFVFLIQKSKFWLNMKPATSLMMMHCVLLSDAFQQLKSFVLYVKSKILVSIFVAFYVAVFLISMPIDTKLVRSRDVRYNVK